MRGLLFICLLVLALAPLTSHAQDSRAVIRDFVELSGNTLFDVWVKLRPFEDHVVTMSFGTHAKSTHTTHYDCEVEP